MRVAVLFTLEELHAYFARHKKLPGSADKFSLQMECIVPEPHHQVFHTHATIRILLPAVRTEFCLIRQRVITIAAVSLHGARKFEQACGAKGIQTILLQVQKQL